MIKPLQRLVGPFSKPIKITPLTKMVNRRDDYEKYNSLVSFNNITAFTPELLEMQAIGQEIYAIPKSQKHSLVTEEDVDDYSYLLQRFDAMLNSLMKTMMGVRKQVHRKIVNLELGKREDYRRYNILKEKLLDKTDEVEEIEAKTELTDKEKIQKLKQTLSAMGFVAGGAMASLITEDLTGLQTGNVHKKGASIAKMLMQRYGLTDIQSAAIVGNFIRESGLVPHNVENSSPYDAQEPLPPPWGTPRTGYGWAQWTGGRLNVFLEKFLGGGPNKRGKAANDGDNWKMLTYELDGPYNHVIQGLKGYTDITQATIYAEREYEGALIKANDERINAARGVLKEVRQMKASGGIVIPEIIPNYIINYDTNRKNSLLSNFIVDRPTIIDVSKVGEPLVVIPTERPIGKMILKMIFDKPFKKIEESFRSNLLGKNKDSFVSTLVKPKQSQEKPSTVVPETKISTTLSKQSSAPKLANIDLDPNEEIEYNYEETMPVDILRPSFNRQENIIDITENKTEDILDSTSQNVIIFTQDIFVN